MTYIRCPQCGARALNVATVCPQCHHVLAQNPMQLGTSSELIACRSCKKYTPRTSATCQFCGAATRGVRATTMVGWVLTVAVLGAGAWGVLSLLQGPAPESVRMPPAERTPPTAAPIEADTEAAAITEAGPSAEPIIAEPLPAGATVIRWTGAWLNLRDGPGHQTNIIRAVAPGTRLDVANPVGGWWRVYVGGVAVGFISGAELLRSPPDSLP